MKQKFFLLVAVAACVCLFSPEWSWCQEPDSLVMFEHCPGPKIPSDEECMRQFEDLCLNGNCKESNPSVCSLEFERHDRMVLGITKKLIEERIDSPKKVDRGLTSVHHYHYQITVHFKEEIDVVWPIKYRIRELNTEVFYLGADHLHGGKTEKKRPVPDAVRQTYSAFEPDTHWVRKPVEKNETRIPLKDIEPLPLSVPVACLPFPSDDQVIRAFVNHLIDSENLDVLSDIPTVKKLTLELLSEELHPPQIIAMIGMAQKHDRKFRCTIDLEVEAPNGQNLKEVFEAEFFDFHISRKGDGKSDVSK